MAARHGLNLYPEWKKKLRTRIARVRWTIFLARMSVEECFVIIKESNTMVQDSSPDDVATLHHDHGQPQCCQSEIQNAALVHRLHPQCISTRNYLRFKRHISNITQLVWKLEWYEDCSISLVTTTVWHLCGIFLAGICSRGNSCATVLLCLLQVLTEPQGYGCP